MTKKREIITALGRAEELDALQKVRAARENRPLSEFDAFKSVRRVVNDEIERRNKTKETTQYVDLLHLDLDALLNGVENGTLETKESIRHLTMQALRVGMMIGGSCIMSDAQRKKIEADLVRERAAKAGAARAAKHRQKAEAGWISKSTPLIVAYRERNPHASVAQIAQHLAKANPTISDLPGEKSIERLVRRLEHENVIKPKGT